MTPLHVDDDAYADIAPGLARRVLHGLVLALGGNGALDLEAELTQDELDLLYGTAFNVLVSFKDVFGHEVNGMRHPAVVGFASFPPHSPARPEETERVLVSWRRTALHGGLDDDMIRDVFDEARSRS